MEWHESKLSVFSQHEQAVRKARRKLVENVVVTGRARAWNCAAACTGKPCAGGLGRAKAVLALGDGAPWIWNVVHDRWRHVHQLLDFYHASQHLWTLGEALHPKDSAARQKWVESVCHQLRHRKHQAVLREIAALPRRPVLACSPLSLIPLSAVGVHC
ncbi:MAG: hypothetical protein ABMA26_25710 [Limisphaerales bacterium]